jgi:competence protein ComEA
LIVDFTKKERTGVTLLLLMGLLFLFLPQVFLHFYRASLPPLSIQNLPFDTTSIANNETKYTRNWQDFFEENQAEDDITTNRKIFDFNPNKISYDSLLMLGFKPSAAKSLTNARKKGFVYRSIEDLKGTYNIDVALIESLKDRVSFGTPTNGHVQKTYEKTSKQISKIEINTADSLQWEQLPNIGSISIMRIFKHRKALGGFHHTEQLLEDQVIVDSIFTAIQPYLSVDPSKIKKIHINKIQYKDLIKHPYFDYKTATIITKYITQHGQLKDPKDIRKIIALQKTKGDKILPYIDVD